MPWQDTCLYHARRGLTPATGRAVRRPGPALLMSAVVALLATQLVQSPAAAHDWYPRHCCSGTDCAPVLRSVSAPGGKWVTSIHGTVFVPGTFERSPSPDEQSHVCMAPDPRNPGKMSLLCYFEPGTS